MGNTSPEDRQDLRGMKAQSLRALKVPSHTIGHSDGQETEVRKMTLIGCLPVARTAWS